MNEYNEYFKQLTSSISPSGFESHVLNLFKERESQYVDAIHMDEMGNLIIQKKCNNPDAQTVLLVAHADEVGFVIKRIDERGFVYVTNIGGFHVNNLPGKLIVFSNDKGLVYGTFGEKPIHMTMHDEKVNTDKLHISDCWVDIGCNDYDEAIQRVSIGEYATFLPFFQIIDNEFVMAKAHNISFQQEVIPLDSRTDAAVLQNTGYNRYIGLISVPIRYMHSSTELAKISDVNAAIELVRNYVESA